jgi:hypothetical protein
MLCQWTEVILPEGRLLRLDYVSTALNLLRSPARSIKKMLAIKIRMDEQDCFIVRTC